ncbi:MAG: AMP-binding protein [Firmicutes bacterium]|nr:AMP-binding protein [Bacillota bacterium]
MNNYQSLVEILQNNNSKRIIHIKSEQEETSVTYQQLYQNACSVLFQLQSWGIKPGDELIIAIEDNEVFLNVFWACLLGKIIAVPVTASTNNENKLKILKIWMTLKNPYLITSQKFLNDLNKLICEKQINNIIDTFKYRVFLVDNIKGTFSQGNIYDIARDDIAFIQFSSGSTGDPKGVILTHQNLLSNINAINKCARATIEDSSLSWLPLTHDMGLIGFHLTPLVLGVNQYILPTSLFMRHPMLWLAKANQHKVTVLSSPNFGYKYFLSFFKPEMAKDWDLSHIRLIFNGAEPISSRLCIDFLDVLEQYGLKRNVMFPVYGLAEASLAVAFPPPEEDLVSVYLSRNDLNIGDLANEVNEKESDRITFVDVGYAVDGCSIRICDADNRLLDEGRIGYIQIKGANVTSGYYNNDKAGAEVISKDGWLNTGDLGFISNGRLVVTGRAKDIIFINGQNYYPHDIERIAEEVDGVELGEVAAFGVPDEEQQNEAINLAVLFKKEIEQFLPLAITLKRQIFKQIGLDVKAIIPIKKIPKTTSGKIMRYKLKEMYQDGHFNATLQVMNRLLDKIYISKPPKLSGGVIAEQLFKILANLLGDQSIGIDDNFLEIGCNSLLLSSFCTQIETANIARISIVDLFSYPSIKKLTEFIKNGKPDSHKSFSSLQIKLSQDYFENKDFNQSKNEAVYLYKMPPKLLDTIVSASKIEKVEPIEILLSLFIYHLFKISSQDEIVIQTMIHDKNQVCAIIINPENVNEIAELFQIIHAKYESNTAYTYSLPNVSSITMNKDRFSIVPFFYNEALLTDSSDLLRIFDITLGILKTNNSIELLFDYNKERLNLKKIEELIHSYILLMHAIASKYEAKHEVIAG